MCRGKRSYKMLQDGEKLKKIPSPEEKRWLTGAAVIRYNVGRIFWRKGRCPSPPAVLTGRRRSADRSSVTGLLLGRESRLEI